MRGSARGVAEGSRCFGTDERCRAAEALVYEALHHVRWWWRQQFKHAAAPPELFLPRATRPYPLTFSFHPAFIFSCSASEAACGPKSPRAGLV